MTKGQMSSNLELYSNAIVGFVVIQNLAFCYQFGTHDFNTIVKAHRGLAIGLSAMFALNGVLGLLATDFIGKRLQQMNEEHFSLIKSVYRGKQIVIVLFSALVILVSVVYGVFGR